MKTEDFFSELAKIASSNEYKFQDLRERIPLGIDGSGRIALSVNEELKEGRKNAFGHTCVTGIGKTDFIRRLILTLAGVYQAEEVAFLIVSPKREYGELLALKSADVFAPVITNLDELWKVFTFVRGQLEMRKNARNLPFRKVFLVLDGLELLSKGSLEVYLPFFKVATDGGAEVVTGVDLIQSAFARAPENFVGEENALITVMSVGEGNISYVDRDCALSLPKSFSYPEETEFCDAIALVNKL